MINDYFDVLSITASVGAELGKPLRWLTQSWLVSLYLDCPPGFGLSCPSSSAVAAFKAAVKAGHITWHAYPTNAEHALADAAMLTFGIELTHDLDSQFGRAPSTVLKVET